MKLSYLIKKAISLPYNLEKKRSSTSVNTTGNFAENELAFIKLINGHQLGNTIYLCQIQSNILVDSISQQADKVMVIAIDKKENWLNEIEDQLINCDSIVIGVFDRRVYQLRRKLLKLCEKSNKTPHIYAPAYVYHPLYEDSTFNTIIHNLSEKTPWDVDFWRSWKSYGVFQLQKQALRLNGDCFEFGCFQGYSASFLAETMEVLGIDKSKRIILFDTWDGMPASNQLLDNYYKKGDFSQTSLDKIKNVLSPWKDRFEYIQGDICKTIKQQSKRDLCYVRIDVDLYEPTKVVLETLFDWIIPNGIVYYDDYVSAKTIGERMAVDEFLEDYKEEVYYMLGERAYTVKR